MSSGSHKESPPGASDRYSRQLLLRQIGTAGQARLAASTAVVVGCGALGCNQVNLLTRAGVGTIRVADRDVVERHNLHRQTLFDEDDVAAGLPKAEAAARKLRRINPDVAIEPRVMDVTAANIIGLLEAADVVLDACDNFETRYVVNDACVKLGVPWVYGGVIETSGMSLTILPGDTPCLRCLFPEPPPPGSFPTCDTVGILGTLPAIIAAHQATEAIKVILDQDAVNRQLVQLEAWENRFRQLRVSREPGCPTCGARRFSFLDKTRDDWVTTLCGQSAVQITPPGERRIKLDQLAEALEGAGQVTDNGLLLQFTSKDGHSLLIFPDGRVVVKGTTDTALARALYSRYVGS